MWIIKISCYLFFFIKLNLQHKYNTNVLKNQQGENIKICNLYSDRLINSNNRALKGLSFSHFSYDACELQIFFFFWQVNWWSWRGPKGAIPHFSFQRPLPCSVSIERHSPWQWNPPFEVGDWQINRCLEGRLEINGYLKLGLHFEVTSIAHCSKSNKKYLKTKTSVLISNNYWENQFPWGRITSKLISNPQLCCKSNF